MSRTTKVNWPGEGLRYSIVKSMAHGLFVLAFINKNSFFLEHKLNDISFYIYHWLMLCPYFNAQYVSIVCVSRKNPWFIYNEHFSPLQSVALDQHVKSKTRYWYAFISFSVFRAIFKSMLSAQSHLIHRQRISLYPFTYCLILTSMLFVFT